MKKLLGIVSVMLVMFTAVGQVQTYRNVTINVVGTRIKQVGVDNQLYPITNTSMTGTDKVALTNLQNGQHQMKLYRSVNGTPATTTFTLREGYDMTINVTANGSIRISETRSKAANNKGAALSTAAFNKIFTATKNRSSSTARATYLQSEFSKANRMFTAQQARTLIQLVNSENSRFNLAKQVYVKVSDKNNFSLVSSLMNSSSNRTALNNYIATVPVNEDEDTNAAYVAMTAQRFNVIYNEVLRESASDRNFYLMNFFNKDFNYYTSNQVKQLIQLVSSESERFGLTKLAYRGITDRDNYYNEMYSLLTSTVSRNELKTYLNTYDQNNTRPEMTSTTFNSLYQTIYKQSSSTTKYNSINTAFTTSGNYFSVAQAKQLIQLINDENGRFALAKASYPTLVDRANYTQLNDLFNYQTTRNNFISYVQNFDNTTPGSTVKSPMADTEFNTLYRNVNNAWTSTSRYNLVLTAFQSTTNYFSASQVRQLLLLVSSETDKLALAKIAYDNITDPFNYTQVNDVFSSTASRTEWARYVTDVQNGGTGTGPGVGTNTPMSETDYNTLYRNVSGSWSSSSKYSLVASALQNTTNYFTIAQVRQLLFQISTESEKLTLAKEAFDNLTDPYNYTQLNDVFNSTENRTEWARYVTEIQNGGTGVINKTAMPDSEYNNLYRSVQFTFGFGAKMSSLMDIFNKETNYFTTEQIKELVSLVSSESNRLELAKLAYNNAVDPQNYSVVASVLSSQSSKDELNVYIGTVN